MLIPWISYTCVLFSSPKHLVNGAPFLNITPLSLLSSCLATVSVSTAAFVMVPFYNYECITIIT